MECKGRFGSLFQNKKMRIIGEKKKGSVIAKGRGVNSNFLQLCSLQPTKGKITKTQTLTTPTKIYFLLIFLQQKGHID